MNKRFHVQRLHVVHSLDSLLYQLHTLSFFLSPSLWLYICRVISQFHCSKPRELDPTRSLRFFFVMLFVLNVPNLWNHASRGAVEGRTVVLDFVGMCHFVQIIQLISSHLSPAFIPSRLHLLSLDLFIMVLQFLLTTIAYETSAYYHSEDIDPDDLLLPDPLTNALTIPLFHNASASVESPQASPLLPTGSKDSSDPHKLPFIIDLHLNSILAQVRNPRLLPPPLSTGADDSVLPLPSTTSWHLPGFRMWMRARQMREGRDVGSRTIPSTAASDTRMNLPGGMDLGSEP
ncbi:LOW QUALITY PROTEIN: hypothetical protein CVT26_011758 [Gymnopilus dilepis]|uniref:DUF1746 domain-containing protein n=1 Tax=Gymnopilus dilepis TaxID=231916 RepID=A0A409W5W3_9AGAR|nr:LOW QUALITY PROTEIN: hypothetical protein CVT26_011758 [Gymnopilus dilepis]